MIVVFLFSSGTAALAVNYFTTKNAASFSSSTSPMCPSSSSSASGTPATGPSIQGTIGILTVVASMTSGTTSYCQTCPSTTASATTSATTTTCWLTFDGSTARTGNAFFENTLTASNATQLNLQWMQTLSAVVDGSPLYLSGVQTTQGSKNLLFVTTMTGSLLAIDAATGQVVWQQHTQGPNITTSSPALDPSGQYVYSYGLDGKVHKYATTTGMETTTGGWPETMTLRPDVEKGSSALSIGNCNTQGICYLYMTISGYNGDGGHYQGHVVAVNLATGVATVFNALCSSKHALLATADCSDVMAGIWARGGAVIDPETGHIFASTGNGAYTANAGGENYGDTVLELNADLSKLLDSYTPANYQQLASQDLDLASAAPALLPRQRGSKTPLMLVQAGKDQTLRLLNRENLSGLGGPNHVGGEIQTIALPQKCEVFTQPAIWVNPQDSKTWVFVETDCGFSAFTLNTDASGASKLVLSYQNATSGSSPLLVNGMVLIQGNGALHLLDATTGKELWNSSTTAATGKNIGALHWQSPIVVNGHIYGVDQASHIFAYALANA